MSNEYLVVLPIEDMPEGASYPQGQSLPLHCTVMPYFHFGTLMSAERLYKKLMTTGPDTEIDLVSEQFALFGPAVDKPCHVLVPNKELSLLHNELFAFLAKNNSLPDDLRYIGAGYRPHVGNAGDRSFPPGTKHVAKKVVVLERGKNKTRKVIQVHDFDEIPF